MLSTTLRSSTSALRATAARLPARAFAPLARQAPSFIALSQSNFRLTPISQPLTSLRSLSSSVSRWSAGASDEALVAKLKAEIKYEQENNDATGTSEPEFLKDFKKEGVWTIVDKPSSDEVVLTRQFGNENIRLIFSIADLDTEPDPDLLDETAEGEEGEEKKEKDEEDDIDDFQPSFPVRTAITITKGADAGALTIDAVAQDGVFIIDNISFYKDAKLAVDLTAEADWSRRGLYIGPQFHHLDEGVQEDFLAFLEERGVDSGLALFIPDLAEWKEQKEYTSWLKGVKDFVKA